jgi:HK97 family phage major capsid protein
VTAILKTDLFIKESLADAVKAGFAGMSLLANTGAVVLNTSMPHGGRDVGSDVKIPYFTAMGEAEDISTDGDALTPATFTSAAQTATVKHSGKAFEMTFWAQSAEGDPYQHAASQIVEAVRRRFDKELIDIAKNETSYSSYINDASAAAINIDAIINTKAKFGDESEDVVAFVCHSKVGYDLWKLKDANGRPLLFVPESGGLPRLMPFGIPVFMTDRLTASANVYPSLLLKRNSLVMWMNGNPEVLQDKDILKNNDLAAVHVYYAAHRYNPMPTGSKPGVAILKTL